LLLGYKNPFKNLENQYLVVLLGNLLLSHLEVSQGLLF